jgi:hypothetical protein
MADAGRTVRLREDVRVVHAHALHNAQRTRIYLFKAMQPPRKQNDPDPNHPTSRARVAAQARTDLQRRRRDSHDHGR